MNIVYRMYVLILKPNIPYYIAIQYNASDDSLTYLSNDTCTLYAAFNFLQLNCIQKAHFDHSSFYYEEPI